MKFRVPVRAALFTTFLTAALGFVAPGTSSASLLEGAGFWENGARQDLAEKLSRSADGSAFLYSATRGDGVQLSLQKLAANPFIDYTISATNLNASPVHYTFVFTTTFASGLFSGALNQLSASLSDGGDNGGSLAPHSPATKMVHSSAGASDVDLGIDIGDALSVFGQGSTTSNFTDVSSVFAPQAFDQLRTTVSVDLTGGEDHFSMAGHTELLGAASAVPEPGSVALMVLGLGALGLAARSRK